MSTLLLAGDVGGTKTALALVASDGGERRIVAEATFRSRRYPGLEAIIAEFLAASGAEARDASFSVAGITSTEGASLPNLQWDIDGASLRRTFRFESVRLINDVQAIAYALPHLSSGEVLALQQGTPDAAGPRAVIAPGTGLGEAFVLPSENGYRAYPSEGGNADFAPTDALQARLLVSMLEHVEHVSYEDLCSGRGLPRLYSALRDVRIAEEPVTVAERIERADDATPLIVEAGMAVGAEGTVAALTLRVFVTILAAEAGNLALRVLATGGVFVGGGIPPRILPLLQSDCVLRAFRRKGEFSGFMERVPFHVIMEPRTALLGAVHYELDS